MTDFWKSNPRRMCDVCKVWMADNKISISMHEGGKKHKENVQRRIKEARKKGVEEIHEKDEIQRQLAAMERTALEAFKKDVQNDPMLAGSGVPARQFTGVRRAGIAPSSSDPTPSDALPDDGAADAGVQIESGDPAVNSVWCAYSTEEGYVYYYNQVSGETSWEKPAGFTSTTPPVVLPVADGTEANTTKGAVATDAASADTATGPPQPVAPHSDASSSSESAAASTKHAACDGREETVSAWAGDKAVAAPSRPVATESESTHADQCTAGGSTGGRNAAAVKPEPDLAGGFVKKPRSGRDAAFGGWSTVTVSTGTSARLSSATAAAAAAAAGANSNGVKAEDGGETKRPKDDDDETGDGLSAGLTSRDQEDDENRFKFREKVLAASLEEAPPDGGGSTVASASGMFKKRKRAGGRRERHDDE